MNDVLKKTDRKLPDLFRFNDGGGVRTVDDWRRRRKELRDAIVEPLYGGMPPVPEHTRVELLHPHFARSLGMYRYHTYRVIADPEWKLSFTMKVIAPPGDGPFPVIINGDGCWEFLNQEIISEIMSRQCALALFNRVEIASDIYQYARNTGIYRLYPDGGFGTLSAWAWSYHRCVDALMQLDEVDDPHLYKHRIPLDTAKIAIAGHSRGGKTTLLAGATDERIALTCANNSGTGGAGSYIFHGKDSEMLRDSLKHSYNWYNREFMSQYIDRQEELPFDQHFLKALIAPRALLTTEALGDLGANPSGTWLIHEAAREAYKFLGAEERIGIRYREGGHAHGIEDWRTFLDFLDWQFRNIRPKRSFNLNN